MVSKQQIKVILVDDVSERSARVSEQLSEEGFEIIAILPSAAGLLFQIEQHRPDVILIDLQSPGRDLLDSLSVVNNHNPTPVVMFSEEDPGFIKDAVGAGVTAYLMSAVDSAKVKPVIDVAIAQFHSYQTLREALDTTKAELDSVSVISKAKQLLMDQRGITEEHAHQQLRKLSMDRNQSFRKTAESVIQILNKK
ncbi:ANTAR domain-containing protein [Pseudomonadales bacterium]|nr:ANTAR domain-containing protein [Pseudomonadales bacterium]